MSLSASAKRDHLDSQDLKQASQLNGDASIVSIRALDEQIRVHEKTIIRLKRARNSLLKISKLPSEILGEIFHWNVALKDDFGRLEKGSHNFLLVCHHWFQVASCTPELWSFWGNTPKEWARWYPYSGTAPLDLVLDGLVCHDDYLNAALCDELQDRAARDIIRRIHLRTENPELLSSIITPLTVRCEGTRSNSVESLVLWNWGNTPVDVSGFFAYHRFPKLRRLDLARCTILSWEHITLQTRTLTVLDLNLSHLSPTPTMSQLLSILTLNPHLQRIALGMGSIPQDDGDESFVRVPLHDLENLELAGMLWGVIRLLHRLDHPKRMDRLTLDLNGCSAADISQIIGPYLRDYLQGRGGSQHGLGLLLSSDHQILLNVGDVHGANPLLRQMDTFMAIIIRSNEVFRGDAQERAILDLTTHLPGEEVVHFQTYGDRGTMRNIYPRFPNLRALTFGGAYLQTMFPELDPGRDEEILLSLQHVSLHEPVVVFGGSGLNPLINFLASRVSSGNRLDTLGIFDSPRVRLRPEVAEVVRGMVRELRLGEYQDPAIPWG